MVSSARRLIEAFRTNGSISNKLLHRKPQDTARIESRRARWSPLISSLISFSHPPGDAVPPEARATTCQAVKTS